ncbi:MAG: glycosyltransferase family 4 protein [Candidatus Moranbacteria bacterium]|nr:glycosyltransferase family 4 protein [Candidatus Moranbacteria bacterium]
MKKILLVTRPLVPPWDEASKNFAYFLGREVRNNELTLLTTKEKLAGLPQTVSEEAIFSTGHFNLRTKLELFCYLRKNRDAFDITHYLFTPTKQNAAIINYFAKPTRGKTIQTIATLRDDLYTPTELKKMFFADHLVVYTDRSKEKLNKLGLTNVTRIYPGIDLNRYQPQSKNPDVLTKLHCTNEHFIVIYPGEYVRLGATDMLVEAWIDFFQKHPSTNIRFIFACRIKNDADAAKKEEVRKRFQRANVLKYISFSDTITDMAALYNTADLIIFPVHDLQGKFDVPLVIIEAYACGKPVILSDLEQFREFSNDAICVTIPRGSKEQCIEKILYLKDNPEKRVSLGEQARHFMEQHFDLKNTAKQYENIYSSL